jgi:hypothetical protein
MTDVEKRAYDAMHEAFCRLRYFSKRPLNELGRQHLFLVADAAHNIPDALAGNAFHREYLERDVAALEALLNESYTVACGKFLERTEPRTPLIQRILLAIAR